MSFVDRIQKLLKNREGVTETPDPTPVEAPFKFARPKSLSELVREAQFQSVVAQEGFDTFEEYDDFEVEDENDLSTDHDLLYEPDLEREITRAEKRQMDASKKMFDAKVKERKEEEARYKKFRAKMEKEKADTEGAK